MYHIIWWTCTGCRRQWATGPYADWKMDCPSCGEPCERNFNHQLSLDLRC